MLPPFCAFTPDENRASITGDYAEMSLMTWACRKGSLAARAWYNAQVFKSFPRSPPA
ncbi:MAG: hypothetical protein MZV63_46790 [Marinilabiliales bacterium]|nr:hypothetical protein [Marinilabiliales bacterium]